MSIIPVAEAYTPITSVTTLIQFLTELLSTGILPLLMGLAVAGFVYGIIKYFLNPENEDKRKNGKDFITWGLISLFIIVSFWGIINIFQNTFTNDVSNTSKIPSIPQQE